MINQLMSLVKESMKDGYRIHFVLVSAKGKEDFYEKFGFTKRPNEITGYGMAQWLGEAL